MKIKYDPLIITVDEAIIAKAAELGDAINDVDISDLRVDADVLARLFNTAEAKPDNAAAVLRYAAMKQAFTDSVKLTE